MAPIPPLRSARAYWGAAGAKSCAECVSSQRNSWSSRSRFATSTQYMNPVGPAISKKAESPYQRVRREARDRVRCAGEETVSVWSGMLIEDIAYPAHGMDI